MDNLQEQAHPEGHDYESGSPHLKHTRLREMITASLRASVADAIERNGQCRVLEVGAGHGDFTDVLLGAGADVVVTEMSGPAAVALADRYRLNPRVNVVHDVDGTWLEGISSSFDLVACISVLHHIPDYLEFLRTAFVHTNPGGGFVSWQDPLWYPRRSKANMASDRAGYYAWRTTQGNLAQGLGTRWRRLRGVYDETNAADMVEYHVVRDGVDEEAILTLAREHFERVDLATYWSTWLRGLQSLGERTKTHTTFGVVASNAKVR
ncbi:MAG: class I SAM-dependent methyltransferase [Actinomycetes bacterium]